MMHGVHIPSEKRDDMARVAVGIATTMKPGEAKRAVAGMFDVSTTTARNLISRGRFLTSSTPRAREA